MTTVDDKDTDSTDNADIENVDNGTENTVDVLDSGDAATGDMPEKKAEKAVPLSKSGRARARAGTQADEPEPAPVTKKEGREFSITLSGRSLRRALGAIVVIALVVAVAVLGWLVYQGDQRQSAFDDSKQVSEDFVTRLVTTINPGNTDKYKEILGPLSTGDLRKRLEQDRADTEQNSQALAIEATSKIVSSSVESVDDDTAKTTVMAEVTAKSANVPNGETRLMIFMLDLSKVDGQWLVSEFSGPPGSTKSGIVDPSQSLPGQGQSAAPTTTPAPGPTPAG
ncbi:hypothetical protein [Gordonia sp. NB41Y]|uniref:Rv0361 family membrane protein n=1 Tax=Gordonia sp. NB41Y TaxID=875808 RepID=UPI0003468A72|nr:hypothetical protein [Gordonia sp. NB41Y]WLP90431.1 hypothetical protein Q9K23_23475 [Gordonia sp. NB41Y]